MLLIAVSIGLGATFLLWLTGEIAGFLHSGGTWPRVSVGDMGVVVARFFRTMGDPAAAWPAATRAVLPGPVTFYVVMAIALLVLTAAYIYLAQAFRSLRRRLSSTVSVQHSSPAGGAIGPSGWARPDLIRHTMSQRWQKGDVYLYDPAAVTGLDASTWSPLGRCSIWQGAYRMARSLVDAGRGAGQSTPDADFLLNAAATLLAALMLAAATSDRSMGDVVRWVQRRERAEVTAALSVAGEPAASDAMQLISSLTEQHGSQVYAAVLGVIAAYADPSVREGVLTNQLSAERLLDGRANTVYVCAPAHEQRRLGPVFAALVQDVIDLAFERSTQIGRPLDQPLLVVLDDAATSAALPQLDVYAASAATRGVQLVTTFRHVSQMQARYGDRAETLLNNHKAKVILSGITDPATLGVLSHLLEDDTVRSLAAPGATGAAAKDGDSLRARYPAPGEALRRITPGQGILLYGHLPPAHLSLRPWFRDRRLIGMVADQSAHLTEPLG